jgi:hypothetical protein
MLAWFLIRLTFVLAIVLRRFVGPKSKRNFELKIDLVAILLFLIILDPVFFIKTMELGKIGPMLFALVFSITTFALGLFLIVKIRSEWNENVRRLNRIE